MRTSYVYLIGADDGEPIKIGHAANVKNRLSALQIGSWRDLSVLHTVTVPSTIAQAVELAMHIRFDDRRVRGEWFSVPLSELKAELDSVAANHTLERSQSDRFSRDVCLALCKQPHKALYVLSAYRNMMNQAGSKRFIASVNAHLLREAGQAAYIMFQMVIVENRDMTLRFRNQSQMARQAESSLVKALDVLTASWEPAMAKWRALDTAARIAA